MRTRTTVPVVEGWFTAEPEPALLGLRCSACGVTSFARPLRRCPNPGCEGGELDTVRLSRRGRIWSYTDARYQPPAPYVPPTDPYEPFAIAAVELDDERMVVLGQVASGYTTTDLRVGDEVELVVEPMHVDDEHEYVVWRWKPVAQP